MTKSQEQINKLLKKVELLEASASILHREAGEIKKMLIDLVDPGNAKLKASLLKRQKKAEQSARLEALAEAAAKRHFEKQQAKYALQKESKKK